MFGVNRVYTSAYHPQTDGLTERFNQTLENMLRTYVNSAGDNWDMYLPLLKFAYNSSVQQTIGMAPFEALYGFSPSMPNDVEVDRALAEISGRDVTAKGYITEMLPRLRAVQALAKEQVQVAQQIQEVEYNRRHNVGMVYEVGDLVLLYVAKFPKKVHRKLFLKWIGPYKITEKRNNLLYKLGFANNHEAPAPPVDYVNVQRLKKFVIANEEAIVVPVEEIGAPADVVHPPVRPQAPEALVVA